MSVVLVVLVVFLPGWQVPVCFHFFLSNGSHGHDH